MAENFPLDHGFAPAGAGVSLDGLPGADNLARTGGPALWRQIAALLREKIDNGAWAKGAKLPATEALAEHFQVNRHTMRQAIAALSEDGLLYATRGRGTFVFGGRPLVYGLSEQAQSADILRLGEEAPDRFLVSKRLIEGGKNLCERFGVPLGAHFYSAELRLGANGIALLLSTLWLPQARFPAFDDRLVASNLSLAQALAHYGVKNDTRNITDISAVVADERAVALLDLTKLSALLVVEALSYDEAGLPTVLSRHQLVPSRVTLQVQHVAG